MVVVISEGFCVINCLKTTGVGSNAVNTIHVTGHTFEITELKRHEIKVIVGSKVFKVAKSAKAFDAFKVPDTGKAFDDFKAFDAIKVADAAEAFDAFSASEVIDAIKITKVVFSPAQPDRNVRPQRCPFIFQPIGGQHLVDGTSG